MGQTVEQMADKEVAMGERMGREAREGGGGEGGKGAAGGQQ